MSYAIILNEEIERSQTTGYYVISAYGDSYREIIAIETLEEREIDQIETQDIMLTQKAGQKNYPIAEEQRSKPGCVYFICYL